MYHGAHRKQASSSEVRKGRTRPRRHYVQALVLGLLAVPFTYGAVTLTTTQAAPPSQKATLVTYTSSAKHYTVRRGDTLSRISTRFCGTSRDYPGIARASGIRNPNLIEVGQRLTIRCGRVGPSAARARAAAIIVSVGYSTHYSYSGLEALWRGAGGPAWAAPRAARIAICESGGYIYAHNPSGASGLWQILGNPFPGNPYNPYTNARMAVAKFRAAGHSFAPWVCR